MKKMIKKTVLLLTAGMLLTNSFTVMAEKATPSEYDPWGTSALGPGYPSKFANYSTIEKVNGITQEKSRFGLSVRVNEQDIVLYISFPSVGGFRLSTDKTGYFEPESSQNIEYKKVSDEKISMTAEDGTKLVYSQEKSSFKLDVYNASERWLFAITPEQIGFGYSKGELSKVRLELPLAEDEYIYGSGERFNELNQVGKRLLMWNVDCGYQGDSSQAELWRGYKNVPILHSIRGYTIFANTLYSGSLDIGYTNESKYTMEFQGPEFDFYIWTGTMEENLVHYTDLTGKSVLLPKWAYRYSAGGGKAVWRENSMYGTAAEAMEKYAELGTPNLAAIYVEDIGENDANVYNIFKKTDTKVLKWNAPDMSLEDMRSFLPNTKDSELPRVKMERNPAQDSSNFFDFTMDNSSTIIKNSLESQVKWGLAGGLIDFGELVQKNTLFRGQNLTGSVMHNFFPYWYAKEYNEAMTELRGEDDFVFFSRAGCAGTQQYTAFFTGDQQASMEGLRQQLVAGLSASSSGLTMWGGDLAGYEGTPTDIVFARGMQFSAFQPVMRSHGTASRFPWDYGQVGISTYQTHYWLRENLLNKIYSTAIVSHKIGTPVTKPLTMVYPDDSSLDGVYETYLFCDDFLVTPVLEESAYLYDVTFPEGNWYSLWTGERAKGGSVQRVETPVDKACVYIKAGSVIPVTVADDLQLTSSMQDVETTEALLVTLPDEDRETAYWKDEETKVVYKNESVNTYTFRITAGEGNDATAVIVKGLAAYDVKVDGKKISRSDECPTAGSDAAYYSEDDSETVINIGNSDWSEITIQLGRYDLSNLMKKATVSDPDLESVIDGDVDSSYVFSRKAEEGSITLQLNKTYELNNLIIKWTEAYADTYTVEVSTNGKKWMVVAEETEGYGGIQDYCLNGEKVKYVRISNVSNSSGNVPRIYEIEAYEKSDVKSLFSMIVIFAVSILLAAGFVAVIIIIVVKHRKPNKVVTEEPLVQTQENEKK